MDISKQAAVVTGGASGLGEATARALAAAGAKIAIFDLNDTKGTALAAELGGIFCKVNVTDEASVDAGFVKARAAIGQERILVNCAGTGNAIKTASRVLFTNSTARCCRDEDNTSTSRKLRLSQVGHRSRFSISGPLNAHRKNASSRLGREGPEATRMPLYKLEGTGNGQCQ